MDSNSPLTRIYDNPKIPKVIKYLILLSSSWTFQGILYMDRSEAITKIILEAMLYVFGFISIFIIFPSIDIRLIILIAFVISHTGNWVFNGQIFVVLKNIGKSNIPITKFIDYTEKLGKRGNSHRSISSIVIYGSLATDQLNSSSDLDVRVIRRNGLRNAIFSNIFIVKERIRAFIYRFPLDIFLADQISFLDKMNKKEIPVILIDKDKIAMRYLKQIRFFKSKF